MSFELFIKKQKNKKHKVKDLKNKTKIKIRSMSMRSLSSRNMEWYNTVDETQVGTNR